MTGTTEPEERRVRRRAMCAWIAVAAVAVAAVRWPGLFDGAGYGSRDELMYVAKAVRYGGGDLNPHYFQNPPLAGYLMFAGIAVSYVVGRIAGRFEGALDFKAAFLAGDDTAFIASRAVVLVLAVVSVAQTASLARELVRDADRRVRATAMFVAACVIAGSPLHVERSAMATNEILVMCAYTAGVHASLLLLRAGTLRAALAAGACVGLAAGAKYSGVTVCAAVAVAALWAPAASLAARIRLLAAAAGASVVVFLVTCPWAVLDAATFRSHVADLGSLGDRWVDGRGWLRYLETLWGEGLGPVWATAAALALVAATVRPWRGAATEARAAAVAAVGVAALAVVLFSHTRMANGRYLLPVYPVLAALAGAEVARRTAGVAWARIAGAGAAAVWFVLPFVDLPARAETAAARSTQDLTADWLHAHVPDGGHVVVDWMAPRLPEIGLRKEFEGKLAARASARWTPAFRVTTAFTYFALPVETLSGTDVPVDDLAGLRAHAPVWIVQADEMEATFGKIAGGATAPPTRWYEVCRDLPVVFEAAPGPGVRGPTLRVRVLR